MKLITDWCRAANDSIAFLPSSSVSPKAYGSPLVENDVRASANVIQPRSPADNADKERVSAASLVPSSFMASHRGMVSAPNSRPIRLIIPILGSLPRGLHQRTF